MENIKKDLAEQLEEYFSNIQENDEQAKQCLNMGIAIYYTEDNLADNQMIKQYPNGKKELICWIDMGKYEVINDNYK